MVTTMVGTPDPEDATAKYRREYKGLMTDIATALRNSGRISGRL